MLSHASAGSDIPIWAMRTAIKSLVPIEPFRLFHRMNKGVKESKALLQSQYQQLLLEHQNIDKEISNDSVDSTEFVSTGTTMEDKQRESQNSSNAAGQSIESNSSTRKKSTNGNPSWLPGGIAHLGYACFWPAGGGLMEEDTKMMRTVAPPQQVVQEPEKQQSQQQVASVKLKRREDDKVHTSTNAVIESSRSAIVLKGQKEEEPNMPTLQYVVKKNKKANPYRPYLSLETESNTLPMVDGPVPVMFLPDLGNMDINNNNNIINDRRFVIPPALW
jgi:hypothetical protein